MRNYLLIVKYTLADQVHYRSFYVFAALSVLLVLLLRGCFEGSMVLDGKEANAVTVGWYASIAAFHLIATAGLAIGALLAMSVFKRDRQNGVAVFFLSKPLKRSVYVLGRLSGVFLLAGLFTFVLHLTVHIIMYFKTGGQMPWFLHASLLTWVNLLFAVSMVLLLTLLMPEWISAMIVAGIALVSYLSDSFYAAIQTDLARSIMSQTGVTAPQVSLVRLLWPKIGALQIYSSSLIQGKAFVAMGPVHPVINVAAYCALFIVLLLWRYSTEEIGTEQL